MSIRMMETELMLDIETLSSQPNAAVIAIGLVAFNQEEILNECEILIDPQFTPGHRNPDTLDWWHDQDSRVFRKMMSGGEYPWDACDQFVDFCNQYKKAPMWANPPTFGISIMRHLFKVYDKEFPIHFTRERDFRTIKKMAERVGVDYSEAYEERDAHDAVDDAKVQARALQLIRNGLALI